MKITMTEEHYDLIDDCMEYAIAKLSRTYETDLETAWEEDPYWVYERFVAPEIEASDLDWPSEKEMVQIIDDEELYYFDEQKHRIKNLHNKMSGILVKRNFHKSMIGIYTNYAIDILSKDLNISEKLIKSLDKIIDWHQQEVLKMKCNSSSYVFDDLLERYHRMAVQWSVSGYKPNYPTLEDWKVERDFSNDPHGDQMPTDIKSVLDWFTKGPSYYGAYYRHDENLKEHVEEVYKHLEA